jgi:hypothetical protein
MSDEDYTRRDYAEDKEDSVQATSVSAATNEKKVGITTTPSPTDGKAPNDQHKEDNGGFDSDGIPKGI